jgi:hypothetical protein
LPARPSCGGQLAFGVAVRSPDATIANTNTSPSRRNGEPDTVVAANGIASYAGGEFRLGGFTLKRTIVAFTVSALLALSLLPAAAGAVGPPEKTQCLIAVVNHLILFQVAEPAVGPLGNAPVSTCPYE